MVSLRNDRRRKKKAVRTPSGTNLQGIGAENDEEILPSAEKLDRQGPPISVRVSDVENAAADDSGPKSVETRVCGKIDTSNNVNRFLDNTEIRATVSNGKEGRRMPGLQSSGVDDDEDNVPIGRVLIRKKTGVAFKRKRERLDDGSSNNNTGGNNNCPVKRAVATESASVPNRDFHVKIEQDSDACGQSLWQGFQEGDMVWAKVKSHPWWPGQVYNPAFASATARRSRKPGHMLIAFFGDSSYGWFMQSDLIPFEPNFAQKAKQSTSRNFSKAVEEAVDEVSRRAMLGLMCACQNPNFFKPAKREGYVAVNAKGYEMAVLYKHRQIEMARNAFQPRKLISFARRMAASPWSGEEKGIPGIQSLAEIVAYRDATLVSMNRDYLDSLMNSKGSRAVVATSDAGDQTELGFESTHSDSTIKILAVDGKKDCISHAKATKSIVQGETIDEKDKYLFKRREGVDGNRSVGSKDHLLNPLVQINDLQIHASNPEALEEEASETDGIGQYVFQKRICSGDAQPIETKEERKQEDKGLIREFLMIGDSGTRKKEAVRKAFHMKESDTQNELDKPMFKQKGSGISEGEAGKRLPTDLQKKRVKKTGLTANSSMENACPGRALEAQGIGIIDDKLSEEKQCVATDTTFTGSGISEGEAGKSLPTDLQKKRGKKAGLTANSSTDNACPGRALEAQGIGTIDDKLSEEKQCVATDTTFTGNGISEGEAGKSSPTDLQKKRGKKTALTANSSTENACPGRALEAQGKGIIDDKLSEENQCVATETTFAGGVEHLLCEEPLPKKHKQLSDVSSVPDIEGTNKLNELQSAHTSPVGAKELLSGSGAEQGSESSPAPIKTPKLGITASEMTDSVKVDDKCSSTDIDVHICSVVLPNVEEDRITRNSIGCASGNAEKDCPGIVHDAFIEPQITASAEVDESQISGTCHIDSRVPGTSGLMEGLQKNGFDGQEKDDSIPLSTETVKADNELSIVPANVNKTNYSFTSGLQSSANLDHAVIKKTKGFKRLVKFAKSSHSEDAFDNGIFPRKKNRLSNTNLPGNQQETERQLNITEGVESTAEPQVDVKSGGADAYPGSSDHGIDAFAADDQGCSTILPDQVQGEKCPSRDLDPESPGLVLHQLLEDLLSLALDPFYGIDRDCPSKVCQAFLRFRSSVYQKSLSLPSSLEASKNGCSLLEVEDEEEIKHKFTVRASEPGLPLSDNKYVNAEDLFSNGTACSETDLVSSLNSKGQPRPQVLKIAKSRSLEMDILAKDNQKRKPDIQSDGLQSLKRLRKVKDLKPVDSLKPGLKQSGKKVLEVSRGDLKESVPQLKKTRLSSVVRPLDSRKTADDPMALCMKFPQGFALPSEVQLKARFARFGPLDISGTRIYCKTGSAQVVFKHSSDAETAYKYATENCLFGQAEVHFRLKQIFQPKQENLLLQSNSEPLKLLKVRNDKILSLLPDVSEEDVPLSRSSDRHGVAEALVENTPKSTLQSRPLVQLKSCLKKPDESGNSTVKETARVTFLLDNEECRPEQDIAMDGSSRTENNTIPVSVPVPLENDAIAPFPIENNGLEPDPPDISHQMLHLLMKCNDIVSDVKRTLGYVPYLPV